MGFTVYLILGPIHAIILGALDPQDSCACTFPCRPKISLQSELLSTCSSLDCRIIPMGCTGYLILGPIHAIILVALDPQDSCACTFPCRPKISLQSELLSTCSSLVCRIIPMGCTGYMYLILGSIYAIFLVALDPLDRCACTFP